MSGARSVPRIELVSRFEPGLGIGTYTAALAAALRQRDYAVDLVQARLPNTRVRELLAVPAVAAKLLRRPGRADVYHADYVDAAVAALLCRRGPLVVTIHDDIPRRYGADRHPLWLRYYEGLFALLTRSEAEIVTVSECSKSDLVERGLDPARIHVVHNGVDHRRFNPAAEPRCGVGALRIGYLATLARRKRVDRLLRAFALVQAEAPQVTLEIGGTGPLLAELTDLARQLRLRNVQFRGFVAEEGIADFYRSLDVFVLPSDYEGFGLTVVEAMACGVPVVTTRVSALPEVVGEAGLLCEPTPEDFAAQILSLVRDPSLRRRYAALGIERAACFDWSRVAEQTVAVYRHAARRQAGAQPCW